MTSNSLFGKVPARSALSSDLDAAVGKIGFQLAGPAARRLHRAVSATWHARFSSVGRKTGSREV
jgi:hypothetical protein